MSIHQNCEPTDCIGPEAQDHLDRIAAALGYNDASYEMADHVKQLVTQNANLQALVSGYAPAAAKLNELVEKTQAESGEMRNQIISQGAEITDLKQLVTDAAMVLNEADQYLSPNSRNSIGTGSILHSKFKIIRDRIADYVKGESD